MKIPRLLTQSWRILALGLAAISAAAPQAFAQASYTGTPYTQNFDSLANTGTSIPFTDNSTIAGWYIENYDTGYGTGDFGSNLLFAGTRQAQSDTYRTGTGDSNTGAVYSFGVAGEGLVTDRALGYVGSGTPDDLFIGVAVQNNSGSPLAGFTITYDGEQWRYGGGTTGTPPQSEQNRPESLVAFYRIGGDTFDASGTWVPVPSLTFTSPTYPPSSNGALLDGNSSANRVAGITATISVPVQINEKVWILWADADHPGGDHGMAIDNFVFTGVAATAGAPVIAAGTTSVSIEANKTLTYQISASGSPTSYGATDLPAWLSINTATGVLTGTPPAPGVFPVTISATNAIGTGSAVLTITVTPDELAPVIESGQVITHLINTPLSYQLIASNSPTSYTCGTLPAGLSFDPVTGIISGTPTATATFTNVAVTATNARGTGSGTITVRLESMPIYLGDTAASFYAGAVIATDSAYALSFSTTPAPFAYEFIGLEATGLQNLSNANLSGTVTSVAGTYPITVRAVNNYGTTEITFNLIVMDQAAQNAIPQSVVVNKFSNSEPDRIELLVVGTGVAGSTADMRGMILKDFSSSSANDGGGRAIFANTSLWSSVPAGTLIVVSAGTTATEDLDVGDYVLRVNMGNTAYFTTSGSFDIAITEMIMIKAAGTGSGGVAGGIHALASGSTTASRYVAFLGPKVGTTQTSAFGFGVFVNNATRSLADFSGTGATGATAIASLNFGAPNNADNEAYIISLRGAPVATALETWRQTNFGNSANSGQGADTADYDGDGIANLVEYATGTNPTVANASVVTVARVGNVLTLTYPVVSDASITYRVLGSDDLGLGFVTASGSTVVNAGVATYTDNVQLSGGVRRFLRLEVGYAAD